jgi:hypothetical protein
VAFKDGLMDNEMINKQELGFKFPAGYKEYCRIFGSGSLGQGDAPEFFRVYCPCPSPSSIDIRQTGHNLIGLKLDMDASEPLEDAEKAKALHRLLEDGYAVGHPQYSIFRHLGYNARANSPLKSLVKKQQWKLTLERPVA